MKSESTEPGVITQDTILRPLRREHRPTRVCYQLVGHDHTVKCCAHSTDVKLCENPHSGYARIHSNPAAVQRTHGRTAFLAAALLVSGDSCNRPGGQGQQQFCVGQRTESLKDTVGQMPVANPVEPWCEPFRPCTRLGRHDIHNLIRLIGVDYEHLTLRVARHEICEQAAETCALLITQPVPVAASHECCQHRTQHHLGVAEHVGYLQQTIYVLPKCVRSHA